MKESRVKIVIKGLNQERAFTDLAKEVKILKLDRTDSHICEVEVKAKDAKKVHKYFRDNNFEILSITTQGLACFFKKFAKSYGIIAGIIMCIIFYFLQFNFIWEIRVYGNDTLPSREVTEFIEYNLPSRWRNNINTKNIEIKLKDSFPKISSVSVALIGQSMVVNINEAILPDEMQGGYEKLVSKYDCRISQIELIQGTLTVKVGDIVRAGETLVEPYIIDASGEKREVKAIARIKADIWLTGTSKHSDSYYKTIRTGKVYETSEVELFGLTIYSNVEKVPFKQYESEEKTENLNKNNILPFKIKKKRYYETKTELIEQSFDAVKDKIIEQAREKALQNHENCEIIKSENFTISEVAGVHIVTYVVTMECEILGG